MAPALIHLTYLNQIQPIRILNSFLWINAVVCTAEVLFFPSRMLDGTRPIGLPGNPIISQLFLFLLIVFFFEGQKVLLFAASFLFGNLVNRSASVTSFFSTGIAFGMWMAGLCLHKQTRMALTTSLLLCSALVLALSIRTSDDDLGKRVYSTLIYYGYTIQGKNATSSEAEKFLRLSSARSSIPKFAGTIDLTPTKLLIGDHEANRYYRLDSSFYSILLNWGGLGLALYYGFWIIALALLYRLTAVSKIHVHPIHTIVLIATPVLGLFNSVIYKFPLMIVCYISFAEIFALYSKRPAQDVSLNKTSSMSN